jgi:hypothetical protein
MTTEGTGTKLIKTGAGSINTLPIQFTDQELEDLIACASERSMELHELMRRAILDDLVR